VDEAEDGGVGADAQGENDDGRKGESRRLDKLPESELEILDHTGEMPELAGLDSEILLGERARLARLVSASRRNELFL
jgi:hypothetical protein